MNLTDIEEAFERRLEATNIAPIVWQNKTKNLPEKPYLTVARVPTGNRNISMDGRGGRVQEGYFVVTVVTATNQFNREANAKAEAVMALFPMGLTLDAGERKLRMLKDPLELPAFRVESDWQQPIRLPYICTGR